MALKVAATLRGMAAKHGTRDVPMSWRISVKRHLEDWIASQGLATRTGRQVAPKLGISQPTLTQIQNCKGALGLHVLLALRNAIGVSLDELLGLPPLEVRVASQPKSGLSDAELEAIRALLRAERDNPTPDDDPPARPGLQSGRVRTR